MEISFVAITGINEINVYVCICWIRIDQRVGYELTESGYETSEPGYESSGYRRNSNRICVTLLYMLLKIL